MISILREENLIMIDLTACLELKHIRKIVGNDENKIEIYEKFVHSLKLLEQLDSLLGDKHYVFKGGTSLLLLFNTSSRFSIDIDICMNEKEYANKDILETVFKNKINPPFIDVVRDKDRTKHGGRDIKAAHYRFFYNPKFETTESYVLLDITFQDNTLESSKIPVNNPLVIQTGEPSTINTIGIDDLLGDKLTAFAPNTIGVKYKAKDQYGRPKCTEIIKQLYDCAFLSNVFTDLNRVTLIYEQLGNLQISYEKNKELNIRSCLVDTINTCELILSGGIGDKSTFQLLMEGVRNFNDYKLNSPISLVDVQTFALCTDIVASKILKKLYPSTKFENKLDYLIRTGIKERELSLIANKQQLKDFFDNCLIAKIK